MSISWAAMTDDDFPSGPLTDSERQIVRRIIRDEDRMRWLWPLLREFGGWAIFVGGILWGAYEFLWKHVKLIP